MTAKAFGKPWAYRSVPVKMLQERAMPVLLALLPSAALLVHRRLAVLFVAVAMPP